MSVAAAVSQLAYLADDTDVGDETHKAGPLAIVVIVVLCVACFFLFRSMSKHLRRVRDEFPDDQEPSAPGAEVAGSSATGQPLPPGSVRPAPKAKSRTGTDSRSG